MSMLPGFTGLGVVMSPAASRTHSRAAWQGHQGVSLADLWTKDAGSGSHQEPAGNVVHCNAQSSCWGVVRMCRTTCDNGEDSGWHACGGCLGVGGWSWDFW
jgi:hypothetical protein